MCPFREPEPEPTAAEAGAEAAGDDHDLIRRAQRGEEEAFEQLVTRHQQRIWRVARSMVSSDEDARDLAQETFLRVFRSLDRFDFQHPFTTWAYRIATNLAIDHLRRRRPTVSAGSGTGDGDEVEVDLPDRDVPDPSRRMEAEETSREVRDCIDSLAPHFQAVLVLREIEGLACTEIAEIVGATHVTVRWRLHRGRKLFQEEWERRDRLREREAGIRRAAGIKRAEDGANAGPAPPVGSLEGESSETEELE